VEDAAAAAARSIPLVQVAEIVLGQGHQRLDRLDLVALLTNLVLGQVGVTAQALGVAPADGWWPDFRRAAEPIGWVRASAPKALEYRNRAVVRLAGTLGTTAPVNESLLAAVGFKG